MHCQERLCNGRIAYRVRADDFPESFYEYRCAECGPRLLIDPRWDVLKLSATSPIIVQPQAFDGLTNHKPYAMSFGRYILRRCETIRERYRKAHISLDEARIGLYASLGAIGAITIDQQEPLVWLVAHE